jgi:hypothetical protein
MTKLCPKPPTPSRRIRPTTDVPRIVARIEREVEAVRGLRFEHPVPVAAITRRQMAHRLAHAPTDAFPAGQFRRRELAWQTIGALPQGTDLAGAVGRFLGTQVVGYYDTHAKELVYVGTRHPTAAERFVLAHELTHALDDQHFDLSRVDRLEAACRDDRVEAATGAIEGSAVYFSTLVLERYVSAGGRREVGRERPALPRGIPQFLLDLESWPYIDGPRFVASLVQHGGVAAVNDALQQLPTSTEQVIDPGAYPGDEPAPVDVPDLAPQLGGGWRDLDVEPVGEEWLRDLLELRLDPTEATAAADGWGGSLYRAWTDGSRAAVLLRTRWDSANDATEFAHSVSDWISAHQLAAATTHGQLVDVAFATDRTTLEKLETVTA